MVLMAKTNNKEPVLEFSVTIYRGEDGQPVSWVEEGHNNATYKDIAMAYWELGKLMRSLEGAEPDVEVVGGDSPDED